MDKPDESGRFGEFGGRFVPEALIPACLELEEAFTREWSDPEGSFRTELSTLLREKQVDAKVVKQAFKDLEINPEKIDPATA